MAFLKSYSDEVNFVLSILFSSAKIVLKHQAASLSSITLIESTWRCWTMFEDPWRHKAFLSYILKGLLLLCNIITFSSAASTLTLFYIFKLKGERSITFPLYFMKKLNQILWLFAVKTNAQQLTWSEYLLSQLVSAFVAGIVSWCQLPVKKRGRDFSSLQIWQSQLQSPSLSYRSFPAEYFSTPASFFHVRITR